MTDLNCRCCDTDHERNGYDLASLSRDRIVGAYEDAVQFGDSVTIKHPSQHEHHYDLAQVKDFLKVRR